MSKVAHSGVGLGNSPRVGSCIFVPSGLAFAGADGTTFGDRKDAELIIDKKVVANFAESERQYAHKATITYNSLQGTYALLLDAYLMTKRFVICKFVEAASGIIYYFIDDPTPASPTGTTNLGLKFVYTHTLQDVVLQIIAQGQMSPLEYDYQISQAGASILGETGGATVGLTGGGYAVNKFIPGNHRTISITNSSGQGLIGSLKDVTFTLESFSDKDTDDRDRFVHNMYRYTQKGLIFNAESAEQGAFNTDVQEDTVIQSVDAVGRIININNARTTFKLTTGDKMRHIEFETKGVCCRNPNEAAPTSLDLGKIDGNIINLSTLGLN